jgi:hypothetical protein
MAYYRKDNSFVAAQRYSIRASIDKYFLVNFKFAEDTYNYYLSIVWLLP